jgi:hypothetical protein
LYFNLDLGFMYFPILIAKLFFIALFLKKV